MGVINRFLRASIGLALFTSFFLPTIASAQLVVGANTLTDAPRALEDAIETAELTAKQVRSIAIAQILMNTVTFALDRLAYDAAVFIAAGGPADEPLFDGRDGGNYWTDYAQAVAGEAVGSLQAELAASSGFGGVLGDFNLCAPRFNVGLSIMFGIQGVFDRPEPQCEFNEIVENWDSFIADVSSEEGNLLKNRTILTQLANAYDPTVNEFQVGVTIQHDAIADALEKAKIETVAHIKNNGFKDLTNVITGNVETPANILADDLANKLNEPGETKKNFAISALGDQDVLLGVGIHTASVFTNTLLSELTQKIYQGLFKFDMDIPDPFGDIASINSSNADGARASYRSFLAAAPTQIDNFSILSEFAACPSATNRGLYNCVMDASFLSAVARAASGVPITVEEAIEEGLLRGSFPLIGSQDVARNQDPYCYTYGYCHTNLVKLRKARVLPIGWELAAESATSGTAPTLQQVVNGFDDCNTAGERDANHPWCKLIDPSWVLKYPETQCRMQGNGQLLAVSGTNARSEECVDMPSCIYEDENGNCIGGFGYCVREENTWSFRGDSCPEQYASCLTLEDSQGEDISLLRNSVDPGPCTEGNAGCLWYDTQKVVQGDGSFAWPAVTNLAVTESTTEVYDDRIYLTSAAEECDEEDGGCRELVRRSSDLRLNILKNPGLEDDANNDDVADGWMVSSAAVVTDTTGVFARSGLAGVNPATGSIYQPGVTFSQGTFYSASFYARQKVSTGSASAKMSIVFTSDSGSTIDLAGTSAGANCSFADNDASGGDETVSFGGSPTSTGYERFSCTFTAPVLADPADRLTAEIQFIGDLYIDDVQVEQGEDASTFAVGYSSASLDTVVAKVAPSYLGCTGAATDPEACVAYAQVCSENDVGCTAYSPTNGNPTITGVANELDSCPSICSGYDTYKQEPTRYEPDGEFPLYFIPTTAETCSEDAVGCSEFTNLATEELEYYTYLRSCVTPEQAAANIGGDQGAVFYTWEGSDSSGYQLREWNLLESGLSGADYSYSASGGTDTDPGAAPCSNWNATDDGVTCSDAIDLDGNGIYDWDTSACDENADIYTNPDCREFYDAAGGIHYRLWSKTVSVDVACQAYRKTDIAGATSAQRELSCESSGGYFDSVLGTCRYLGLAEESDECSDNDNGCRSYTGGRGRNSRVAFSENFEDGTVSAFEASSASFASLSSESLATGGQSMVFTDVVRTHTYSNGSTCTTDGGCSSVASPLGGSCVVSEGETYCGTLSDELFSGKTYTISFLAKGTGTVRVGFDLSPANGSTAIDIDLGTFTLTDGWTEISAGPMDTANLNAADFAAFGTGTALVFDPSATAYIDNLTVREGEDNLALIRGSWSTPAICDQSPTGAASSQYYLGCQEYSTHEDETVYLKSFSKLCSDDVVGCDAFFMTQESEDPYASVHNLRCNTLNGLPATSATSCYYESNGAVYDTTSQYLCTIGVGTSFCTFDYDGYTSTSLLSTGSTAHLTFASSTQVALADTDAFLVVTDDVTCATGAAGCTEIGLPTFSQDRNSTLGAASVYRTIDPDTFDEVLCEQDELFCEAWSDDANTTYYFKNPLGQRCEYRTDVTILGSSYDGWFREGSDSFCYGTCTIGGNACSSTADCTGGAADTCNTQDPSYLVGGELSGLWRNGDAQFGGWAGMCEPEYSTCTEYFDPLDVDSDEVYSDADGESYVFLNNDNLDENVLPASQRCDGQASLKEGCALFLDTGTSSRLYNASATEAASKNADVIFGQAPYSLVDPINCDASNTQVVTVGGETIDLCAQRCVYDRGQVLDITDGVGRVAKMSQETSAGNSGLYTEASDVAILGTSCYSVSDCSPLESETGEMIKAYDCTTEIRVTPPALGVQNAPVDRLENDTNTLLKVNRDRQCSEWLTCANYETVWDENSATFKTVCSDVELCSGYTALGDASFCDDWNFEDPEIVLDVERYTSRDVSWYGDEYSGMAIPDLYPVQALTQANIAPEPLTCDLRAALANGSITQTQFNDDHGDACISWVDCGVMGACVPEDTKPDYRLALDAGSCEENDGFYFGESCSVGVCETSGAACSSSASCGSGDTCVVGGCYNIDTADFCAADADCDEGDICLAGSCATPGATVTVESFVPSNPTLSCGSGESFIEDIQLKVGTCLNERCLLTPDGNTFDTATAEAAECRLYPEKTSPFSTDVVERWYDPEAKNTIEEIDNETLDATVYSTRAGFDQVNTCAPGEECLCSYTKVSYGQQGGDSRYYSTESRFPDSNIGLCSGGEFDNVYCSFGSTDSSAISEGDCETGGGVCQPVVRADDLYGITGYCLERDSAININGDRDEQACVTWLPVDQLAGQTNLFAKYTTAGVASDLNYCGEIRGYANIDSYTACAESLGEDPLNAPSRPASINTERSDDCRHTISCPEGFWAVGGRAKNNGGTDTNSFAEACTDAVNACPYVCVPYNSFHANGDACETPSEEDLGFSVTSGNGLFEERTEYFFLSASDEAGYDNAQILMDNYLDCTYYGSSVVEDELGFFAWPMAIDLADGGSNEGFDPNGDDFHISSVQRPDWETYPACENLILGSSADVADVQNYAWTDRVLNPDGTSLSQIAVGDYVYEYATINTPWAGTISVPTLNAGFNDLEDPTPAVIPACVNPNLEPYDRVLLPVPDADNPEDCSFWGGDFEPAFASAGSLQAKPFLAWDSLGSFSEDVATSEDASDIIGRLQQLFAKPAGLISWVIGDTNFTVSDIGGEALGSYEDGVEEPSDVGLDWDVRGTSGVPPKIWSLDMNNCSGTECAENQENAFTINTQDGGNISAIKFYRANLKFYAAADKNQLPLRRIIIDWGDGIESGSDADDNFYKNHRGLQNNTTVSRCDLASEWGLTDESCDPNYLSYNHIYTCTSDIIQTAPVCSDDDGDGILDASPCVTNPGLDAQCTFQPRVHVRDNWGWCTGVCVGGVGGDGCFEGTVDTLTSPNNLTSECAYQQFDEYDELKSPWVYYDGVITVSRE